MRAFIDMLTNIIGDDATLLFQLVGIIGAIALGLTLAFLCLRGIWQLVASLQRRLSLRAKKAQKAHEILILFAKGRNNANRQLIQALKAALSDHLPAFSFGAQFLLRECALPLKVFSPQDDAAQIAQNLALGQKYLRESGADILVWVSHDRKNAGRQIVHALLPNAEPLIGTQSSGTKASNSAPNPQALWCQLQIDGRAKDWSQETHELVAYVLTRWVRPILDRPQDYRPEKLQPMAERLTALRQGLSTLDVAARQMVVSDLASVALSLGERTNSDPWLHEAYEARRVSLEGLDPIKDGYAWAIGQADLARALTSLGGKSLDMAKLDKAREHLNLAMDHLRGNDVILQAEIANRTLARIDQAVADRKRVFLRYPV